MTDSAEIARLEAEAARAAAEAAVTKVAAAQAALDAATASTLVSAVEQVGEPCTTDVSDEPPAQTADAATPAEPAATTGQPQQPAQEPVQGPAPAQTETAAAVDQASGSQEIEKTGHTVQVRSGYSFSSLALPAGTYLDTLSDSEPAAVKGLSVGIPLGLLGRHTLVAGVTGTGKARTLQLLAKGPSAADVPVFLADVRGDLTGLAKVGASSDKTASHIASTGQDWTDQSFLTELFSPGGSDSSAGTSSTPIRTTVTEFGPILLSRVLGLNNTQASTFQLVFHWVDSQGLALLDLKDLRVVVDYLTNAKAGKGELKTIGGVSAAATGAILREIAALGVAGGEALFDELTLDVRDLIRVSPDGRGVISTLELADIQSQGTLFSTFLMWLFVELFGILPGVGDSDEPIMVFFFGEAHLLFSDTPKAFLKAVTRTVRLIRSKGVGIVSVTQSPTDVPDEALAQPDSRIQHVPRIRAPADAASFKKAVSTFPVSPVDLSRVLAPLGAGQAVVNMLDEKGCPTPVTPVIIDMPTVVMGPAQDSTVNQVLAFSPPKPKYATSVDNEFAYELLVQQVQANAEATEAARAAEEQAKAGTVAQKALGKEAARQTAQRQKEAERLEREAVKEAQRRQREAEGAAERRKRGVEKTIGSVGRQITREITRSIFGTLRRR